MEGGYLSLENINDTADASNSNNASTISSRIYLKVYDIGSSSWESVTDIRDKTDFFERVDDEKLQLSPGNDLQLYQLYARSPTDGRPYYATFGRFSAVDAGGDFVDGAEVGKQWTPAWRSSIFGGLDPKRPDQYYVKFNSDSQVFGTYTSYQPLQLSWAQNTLWNSALVGEEVQSHLDRLYWYNNLIYSWSNAKQFFGMMYLDFVPNVHIQSGVFSFHDGFAPRWSTTLNLTLLDVIEYSRRQGVLETLSSSPYREGSANFRYTLHSSTFIDLNTIYGKRQADGLSRAEISAGPSFYRLMDDHLSTRSLLGLRHDFTSNDTFCQAGANYYAREWEYDSSLTYAFSAQSTGLLYHKLTMDLAATRYLSSSLLWTLQLERAQDEQVQIWSGFAKVSYMFGQKDLAPVRTTAPIPLPPLPEGRLQ